MPRPVYMVCSESCALDQHSKLLSLFHVLEGYDVVTGPIKEGDLDQHKIATSVPVLMFVVTAVWMSQDDDSGHEFEYELLIDSPGEPQKTMATGKFVFEKGKNFHRLNVFVRRAHPWIKSGICILEHRIRRVGSDRWYSQDFPLPITVRNLGSEVDG